MTDQFQQVRPGDLIRADLFNALLGRLAEIEDLLGGTGGLIEVPRLVGLTLGQAQGQLGGFVIGDAFDVTGTSLNPNTNEARARRVLNQVPAPGMRVATTGEIDVILSATISTGPQPTLPTITSVSPRPVQIGAELTINGTNFGSPGVLLTATIDGQPVEAFTNHVPTMIRFVVPTLANVPQGGRDVQVVVTTPGGTVTTNSLEAGLRPRVVPASGTLPVISTLTDITGASVPLDGNGVITVGTNVIIDGQNFGATVSQNQIVITAPSGLEFHAVNSATPTRLVFTVPLLPGQSPANPFISAQLAVQVGEPTNRSVAVPLTFRLLA